MLNKEMLEEFRLNGFVTARGSFDAEYIDDICNKATENFNEVNLLIQQNDLHLGIGIKEGFSQIVQRHQNRFEVPYRADDDIFSEIASHPQVVSIATSFLGPDWKIINRSVLMSLPGSQDQGWHADGPHLSVTSHLECHCFNLFVPLVDVTEVNGPTEFRPESHYMTRDLSKMYLKAFATKSLKPIIAPTLEKGSILAFDYRVLHRGKANRSDKARPVYVLTFAKSWFKDILNFPKASIFDPPTAAVPVEGQTILDSSIL